VVIVLLGWAWSEATSVSVQLPTEVLATLEVSTRTRRTARKLNVCLMTSTTTTIAQKIQRITCLSSANSHPPISMCALFG